MRKNNTSSGLFERIHQIVAKIPKGKVTTYGHVAELSGIKDARKVGWALCKNEDPKIPCHRVLRKGGFLAEHYAFGDWHIEREKLLAEGITFISEKQVDIQKHQWETE